ncbi:fluoride efflux transporter FluC [Streptomyces albidoflavus]
MAGRRRCGWGRCSGTGFLGGFTTFSSYADDIRVLLEEGEPGTAIGYLAATVAAALLAVAVAGTATRTLISRARNGRLCAPGERCRLADGRSRRRSGRPGPVLGGHVAEAQPWTALSRGTFVVNAAASLLFGIAVLMRLPQPWVQSLVAVGFCGALSTWSTLAYESAGLVTTGRQVLAAGYVAASVGAGLGLAYTGSLIGRAGVVTGRVLTRCDCGPGSLCPGWKEGAPVRKDEGPWL